MVDAVRGTGAKLARARYLAPNKQTRGTHTPKEHSGPRASWSAWVPSPWLIYARSRKGRGLVRMKGSKVLTLA